MAAETATITVDREQVLAYRAAVHGLHRDTPGADTDVSRLAVLDIGVQNTPPGSARLALAARLPVVPDPSVSDRWDADDGPLSMVWSLRGSPHLHRTGDLPWLAAAVWPRSDADAAARTASGKTRAARQVGISPMAALELTVAAYGEVFADRAATMSKGEASTGLSARLPDVMTPWCEPCQANHLSDLLMTQAALPAGIRLRRRGGSLQLSSIPGWDKVEDQTSGDQESRDQESRDQRTAAASDAAKGGPDGPARLVMAYLRLLGPATLADVAGFMGTTRAEVRTLWPEGGLVEMDLDGTPAWLPETQLELLRSAPPAPRVRLLPASDPYLQVRNRELLVADPAKHAQVWKSINQPGAVVVDGAVAGVWRARAAGKTRLDVQVTPFTPLPAAVNDELEDEAERLAVARGATSARVHSPTA